jgi:hypothetical protein
MRRMWISTALGAMLATLASAREPVTPQPTDVPCSQSAGVAKANEYVRECLQVSPATHPPCNVSNACSLITEEIKRGCAMIATDRPAFCAEYRDEKE